MGGSFCVHDLDTLFVFIIRVHYIRISNFSIALFLYLCYTRFIPTRFRNSGKIMLILLFLSFGISPDVF